MGTPTIEKVSVPESSVAKESLPSIHYSDSYKVSLPGQSSLDIKFITTKFLTAAPSWVSSLMKLRDRIVRFIGLKTSRQSTEELMKIEKGNRIGIFRVFYTSPHEVVLGEDDRHLNFRVSILTEEENGFNYVTVSTIVHFHNWLGRLYFLVVREVHKLIVPAMLKNLQRHTG